MKREDQLIVRSVQESSPSPPQHVIQAEGPAPNPNPSMPLAAHYSCWRVVRTKFFRKVDAVYHYQVLFFRYVYLLRAAETEFRTGDF